MSSFKYIADYPLFYPDKVGADGSLMATKGMVVDWDQCPNAAVWVETDEAPTWGGEAPVAPAPEPPAAGPEPAQEAPEAPAEPEGAEPEAEPAEAVSEPAEPEPPKPLFPGYAPPDQPYSR